MNKKFLRMWAQEVKNWFTNNSSFIAFLEKLTLLSVGAMILYSLRILIALGLVILLFAMLLFYEQIAAYLNRRETDLLQEQEEKSNRKESLKELLFDARFDAFRKAYKIDPPGSVNSLAVKEALHSHGEEFVYHFKVGKNSTNQIFTTLHRELLEVQKQKNGGMLPYPYFYVKSVGQRSTVYPDHMQAEIAYGAEPPIPTGNILLEDIPSADSFDNFDWGEEGFVR